MPSVKGQMHRRVRELATTTKDLRNCLEAVLKLEERYSEIYADPIDLDSTKRHSRFDHVGLMQALERFSGSLEYLEDAIDSFGEGITAERKRNHAKTA